jgi:hypothetical protein
MGEKYAYRSQSMPLPKLEVENAERANGNKRYTILSNHNRLIAYLNQSDYCPPYPYTLLWKLQSMASSPVATGTKFLSATYKRIALVPQAFLSRELMALANSLGLWQCGPE